MSALVCLPRLLADERIDDRIPTTGVLKVHGEAPEPNKLNVNVDAALPKSVVLLCVFILLVGLLG